MCRNTDIGSCIPRLNYTPPAPILIFSYKTTQNPYF